MEYRLYEVEWRFKEIEDVHNTSLLYAFNKRMAIGECILKLNPQKIVIRRVSRVK